MTGVGSARSKLLRWTNRFMVPDLRPNADSRPGASTLGHSTAITTSRYRRRPRKLTPLDEAGIRALASTKSLRSLAADFGVSHETVRATLRNHFLAGGGLSPSAARTVLAPSLLTGQDPGLEQSSLCARGNFGVRTGELGVKRTEITPHRRTPSRKARGNFGVVPTLAFAVEDLYPCPSHSETSGSRRTSTRWSPPNLRRGRFRRPGVHRRWRRHGADGLQTETEALGDGGVGEEVEEGADGPRRPVRPRSCSR